MPRTRRGRRIALGLLAFVVAAVMWGASFIKPYATGFGDWQWFHFMWESGRASYLRFHEVPLWQPYHCGGVPMWGGPQTQLYAPTYLFFGLIFGTTIGHKLYLLFHATLGLAGMYVLCRRIYGLDTTGACAAAFIWCCSGFFAWHGAGGHATYLAFYYGPWILYSFRRALREPRWTCGVAIWMTMCMLEGGHYPFPFFVLLLAFDAIGLLLERRATLWQLTRTAVVSGLLTLGLGAMRVVPILITVTRYPKIVVDDDHLSIAEVFDMLTSREQRWSWPPHRWVWPEYGAYVGWIVLAIAAIGLIFALLGKGRRHLIAGFLLFFGFTMGAAGEYYPWPLMQHLPVYKSIHLPSRWRVLLTFYVAMLAGLAVARIGALVRRRASAGVARAVRIGLALVVLGAAADMLTVNLVTVERWHGTPIDDVQAETPFYLTPGLDYWSTYASYPMRNVGTTECYDPVPWPRATGLWYGPGLQARIENGGGTVKATGRTNNTAWADVSLRVPTRVVFNQNWAPGFVTSAGTVIRDPRGRLAVEAPAGDRRITVRYQPEDLPWSALASLATLVGIVVALRLRPRDRRRAREMDPLARQSIPAEPR